MQPILRPPRNLQACYVCKYRRRRCAPDCIFADYFPRSRNSMDFDNVHKVFGLINVTRMIGELEKVYRDKTMECIIYEANMRSAYPVEGCCRFIRMLHRSIKRTEAELTITRRLIASLRAHQTPEETAAAAAPYLEVEDSQFFDFLQEDAHNNEYYNHLPLPSLQLHQEPNQEQPSADINNALLQEQMLNSRAAPDSGSSSSSRVNHGAERVDIIRDNEGSIQELAQEHGP